MKLETGFWDATPVASVPLLRRLNDWVIRQNEKRLPKWKFKFASDLAAQVQSKLTRKHALLFECIAIRTENVSVRHFTEPNLLRESVWQRLPSQPSTYTRLIKQHDRFCIEHALEAAATFLHELRFAGDSVRASELNR